MPFQPNPMSMPRPHRILMLRRGLACLMLFSALAARAGLNLTNFTGTNVIQVMPVGDSITDDCVTNGAWRKPLQPLLDSNHVPFNFTGRGFSSYVPGQTFTKLRHEGYCGAVIAPPGVSTPMRFYTLAENYLQNIVPD